MSAKSSTVDAILAGVREELQRDLNENPEGVGSLNSLFELWLNLRQAYCSESGDAILAAAIKCAATAVRIAVEGDKTWNQVRSQCGLDEFPEEPRAKEGDGEA